LDHLKVPAVSLSTEDQKYSRNAALEILVEEYRRAGLECCCITALSNLPSRHVLDGSIATGITPLCCFTDCIPYWRRELVMRRVEAIVRALRIPKNATQAHNEESLAAEFELSSGRKRPDQGDPPKTFPRLAGEMPSSPGDLK
jgi:hypothetical protein